DHHRHVVALALGVDHIAEQERAPLMFGYAADELPAHQRMQLGVLIDRPIDADEQAFSVEIGEMGLEIEARSGALADAGGIGGFVEHLKFPDTNLVPVSEVRDTSPHPLTRTSETRGH